MKTINEAVDFIVSIQCTTSSVVQFWMHHTMLSL